jgi:hypothetical protein
MAQKQDYRELSKFEKFEIIKDNLISFCERKAYAEYLKAIWLNDVKTISYFESFGDHPRKIISNYRNHKQNLKFGFESIIYDEYGWIERPVFLEKEEILVYVHKNGWKDLNNIQVAVGKNGKWTNGIWCQTNTGGNVNGISVWGGIFETKEQAIINACQRVIKFHQEHDWSSANAVIKAGVEIIETAKGNRPVQLSFF